MLHVKFTAASGGLTAATNYRDALDAYWGYPRGVQFWNQHFADVLANTYAQADALDPLAAWAIDISNGYSPAGQDYEDSDLYVFAVDITAHVPWPDGAEQYDLEPNDPVWTQPE